MAHITKKLSAKWTITLYVAALVAACSLLTLLIEHRQWLLLAADCMVITGIAVNLVRYTRKADMMTSQLLDSLLNNDTSARLHPSNKREEMLTSHLDRIRQIILHNKEEISRNELFFRAVFDHVNTGIMIYDSHGAAKMTNPAMLKILNRYVIKHITQLHHDYPKLCALLTESDSIDNQPVTIGKKCYAMKITSMATPSDSYRIVTLEDIDSTIIDRDMDAWAKFSSVTMHELMNALTPIESIMKSITEDKPSDISVIRTKLATVQSTTTYLRNFVEGLRSITRLPQPRFALFYIHPFINRAVTLACHIHRFPEKNIHLRQSDKSLMLYTDESLMAQVMTNILKNFIEALSSTENPAIEISVTCKDDESIEIELTNNGPEIPDEVADNIFIPFFTTKKHGSGIGLPLSRQLVRLCGGSLKLTKASPHPAFLITIK